MNLYEFPTSTSRQNDSFVMEFVSMGVDMTNEALVMFMTGFLVARFKMFAESQLNFTLRETLSRQLHKINNNEMTREQFIRGVVLMLEENGQIEKVYQRGGVQQQPDRLNQLVMFEEKADVVKVAETGQEGDKNEQKAGKMKSEEERMVIKEHKQLIHEETARKPAVYESRLNKLLTPKKQAINWEREAYREKQPRAREEFKIMSQRQELANALQAIEDLQEFHIELCSACRHTIYMQDLGVLKCEHTFHRGCMNQLIKESVEKKKPLRKCPAAGCGKDLKMLDVTMYVEGDDLERYAELVAAENYWNVTHANNLRRFNREEEAKAVGKRDHPQNNNQANGEFRETRNQKLQYKQCPQCQAMVELVSNSTVLLCNCGSKICLKCEGAWCEEDQCLYEKLDPKMGDKNPRRKK